MHGVQRCAFVANDARIVAVYSGMANPPAITTQRAVAPNDLGWLNLVLHWPGDRPQAPVRSGRPRPRRRSRKP